MFQTFQETGDLNREGWSGSLKKAKKADKYPLTVSRHRPCRFKDGATNNTSDRGGRKRINLFRCAPSHKRVPAMGIYSFC